MTAQLKKILLAMLVLAVSWLAMDNFGFDPERGIVTRGELHLSWAKPVGTGDAATELAGYSIHCWDARNRRSRTVQIDDPNITAHEIDRLSPGIYQCAMSTVDVDGAHSVLSNVLTQSVY